MLTIARSFLKVLGCSAIMYGALVIVQTSTPPENGVRLAVSLGEHLAFGAAVFLALARLFDSDELHLAINLLVRRAPPADLVALP